MRRHVLAIVLVAVVALSLLPVMGSVALAQVTVSAAGATTVVVTPSNFTSIFKVANGIAYLAVGNESSPAMLDIVFTRGTYNFSALGANTVVLNGSATLVLISLESGAVLELGKVRIVYKSSYGALAIEGVGSSTQINGGEISATSLSLNNVTIHGTSLYVSNDRATNNLDMYEVYGSFRAIIRPEYTDVHVSVIDSVARASILIEKSNVVPTVRIAIERARIGALFIMYASSASKVSIVNSSVSEIRLVNGELRINSSSVRDMYVADGNVVLDSAFVHNMYVEGSNVTIAFSTVNMMRAIDSSVTTYASMIKMVSKMRCHCIEKRVRAHLICVEWMGHRWCARGNVTVPPVMHPVFRVINATHAKLCINATYCITVPIYALNMSRMFMSTELGNQSLALPMMCKRLRHVVGMVIANSNITKMVEKVMGTKMIVNMTLETPGNVSLVLPTNVTVRAVYKNGTLWHNYTVEIKGNATIVNIGDPTNVSVVIENATATNTTTPSNTTTTPSTTPTSKPAVRTEAMAVVVGVLAVVAIGATILAIRRRGAVSTY